MILRYLSVLCLDQSCMAKHKKIVFINFEKIFYEKYDAYDHMLYTGIFETVAML